MVTSRSSPSLWKRATGSLSVRSPWPIQVTVTGSDSPNGTRILWVNGPSGTTPKTPPGATRSPTETCGVKLHLRSESSGGAATPRGRKKPCSSAMAASGFCRPSKTRPKRPGPKRRGQHLAGHFDPVAHAHAAGVLEHLHVCRAPADAEHLGLQPLLADAHVTHFVLHQRRLLVHLDQHEAFPNLDDGRRLVGRPFRAVLCRVSGRDGPERPSYQSLPPLAVFDMSHLVD